MKKLGILGTTTLAGALLFTGVNSGNAHAAEQPDVEIANQSEWQQRHDEMVEAKKNSNGMGGEGGGPGSINTYDKTYQEYVDNNKKYAEQVGADLVVRGGGEIDSSDNAQATQQTEQQEQQTTQGERPYGGVTPDNMTNEEYAELEQNVPNPNEVSTEEYNQAVESETARIQNESEQTSENTNASQSKVSELPETGSEETNNTAITTMIATILLAVGSLLTFKRLSKSNK